VTCEGKARGKKKLTSRKSGGPTSVHNKIRKYVVTRGTKRKGTANRKEGFGPMDMGGKGGFHPDGILKGGEWELANILLEIKKMNQSEEKQGQKPDGMSSQGQWERSADNRTQECLGERGEGGTGTTGGARSLSVALKPS